MRKRDMHVGKSLRNKIEYGKRLKSLSEIEETIPKKVFDSSDSSTSDLDLIITPQKKRPRTLNNIIFNKQMFSMANILKGFFSIGGLALILNIVDLNRDLGRVEERVKDIPVISEKLSLIYEKLGKIDANIGSIKVIIEKNDELYKNKFDNLDKRINSINKKIEK